MTNRGSGKVSTARGRGEQRAGSGSLVSRDLTRWLDFNERQRAYLAAVYREDQQEEARQRSAWARGTKAAPAEEWRWVLYGSPVVDETRLRSALKEVRLVDRGAGSTFAALADRGLLLTRKALVRVLQFVGATGDVEVLYARMTKKGRAAVRAAIRAASEDSVHSFLNKDSLPTVDLPKGCLPGETKLPAGTLRVWHWRGLARTYAAGEKGLPSEYGGDFSGIRERTWRRLESYRDGALVIGKESGTPWGAPWGPEPAYILSITEAGRRFYEERWEEYRQRYPEVEVPRPSLK